MYIFLVTPPRKKWQSPSREIEHVNFPLWLHYVLISSKWLPYFQLIPPELLSPCGTGRGKNKTMQMVKLCFFKWLFGINLNQVWSCLLHWIAIPRCSSSAILRRRSLLLVTAAGLKGSASGVEPPHAVGLNQSSTMRKKHWRLEILICIFDTNTPWSKRERIKQLLVSSEGITSITVYCITNNYRACMYFIALYIYGIYTRIRYFSCGHGTRPLIPSTRFRASEHGRVAGYARSAAQSHSLVIYWSPNMTIFRKCLSNELLNLTFNRSRCWFPSPPKMAPRFWSCPCRALASVSGFHRDITQM